MKIDQKRNPKGASLNIQDREIDEYMHVIVWMESVLMWDDVHMHLKSNRVFLWTVMSINRMKHEKNVKNWCF